MRRSCKQLPEIKHGPCGKDALRRTALRAGDGSASHSREGRTSSTPWHPFMPLRRRCTGGPRCRLTGYEALWVQAFSDHACKPAIIRIGERSSAPFRRDIRASFTRRQLHTQHRTVLPHRSTTPLLPPTLESALSLFHQHAVQGRPHSRRRTRRWCHCQPRPCRRSRQADHRRSPRALLQRQGRVSWHHHPPIAAPISPMTLSILHRMYR
ncbi:hypothetical protein C8Q74DRAFT_996100 [Fomes fomentarius]|nr:hypothetical protein C8Q74DRAFT_996100 [Fomes fomentarius]